jgi:hypothetical protein
VLPLQAEQFLKKCLLSNVHPCFSSVDGASSQAILNHFNYYGFVLGRLTKSVGIG